MPDIYIFGHKNPDTDSICSAVAYEYLKNKISGKTHIACRLGEINKETEYVLARFNVQVPPLMHDVHPQIRDTQYYPVVPLEKGDTISHAWNLMKESSLTLAPVVENGVMTGIVSTQDITEAYMELVNPSFTSEYSISVGKIAETLAARIICGEPSENDIPSRVVIFSNSGDKPQSRDLLLCADDEDAVWRCLDSAAKYIIISGNFSYNDIERIKKTGEQRRKIIIYTGNAVFAITRMIAQALPVGSVMKSENIIAFRPNSSIDDVAEIMLANRHRYFPVVDVNYAPLGLISRRQLMTYKRKQVILVDHNEMGQTAEGIEKAEILEIIDHHRLGDIQTGSPLFMNCRAVGSTCSIVAEQYFLNNVTPPKNMAGIMLSAIISDTLLLRSPTCTAADRDIAEKLAEICGVDMYEYGYEMLKAGAATEKLSPERILQNDAKPYEIGCYKIHTCQVLTTDIDTVKAYTRELERGAAQLCMKFSLSGVVVIITDFIRYGSEILVFGNEKEIISEALGITEGEGFMDGVMSRKSQIIPRLVLNLPK